jgi:ureidoacrylate peracid hydrolase
MAVSLLGCGVTEMSATNQIVSVEAKPFSLTIDLAKTVVLVIDMQNDFGTKGGMFDLAGLELAPIQSAVAPTARVIAQARTIGIPIVYVNEELRADMSDIAQVESPHRRMSQRMGFGNSMIAPDGRTSRIRIENTWNTETLPELAPQFDDIIVTKRRWSGFYETELDARLRALGAQYLIVTGCTTTVCVESTIRDAAYRDYACLLPADCTAQPAVGDPRSSTHDVSLLIIARHFGWVTTSQDVVTALARLRSS